MVVRYKKREGCGEDSEIMVNWDSVDKRCFWGWMLWFLKEGDEKVFNDICYYIDLIVEVICD